MNAKPRKPLKLRLIFASLAVSSIAATGTISSKLQQTPVYLVLQPKSTRVRSYPVGNRPNARSAVSRCDRPLELSHIRLYQSRKNLSANGSKELSDGSLCDLRRGERSQQNSQSIQSASRSTRRCLSRSSSSSSSTPRLNKFVPKTNSNFRCSKNSFFGCNS